MAKTVTSTIKNMAAGEVEDETREWFRVTADDDVIRALEAWEEYQAYLADIPAWEEVHGPVSATNPAPFAECVVVADPDAITMPEKMFVECRFFATHDDGSARKSVNVGWCQINSVNTPGLSAGFLGDLLKIFNARRATTGLEPAV